MGSRGPLTYDAIGRPKRRGSSELTLIAGEDGTSPIVPAAPPSLGGAGREAWEAVYASCPWLTSAADHLLVCQWCELAEERELLRARIARGGRVTKGSQGQRVDQPLIGQLRGVENAMLKLGAVLGIGPAARARLGQRVTTMPTTSEPTPDERQAVLRALGAER
jgi:P27 family predicted phage terminase small subunit